jgi:hypothetical protein
MNLSNPRVNILRQLEVPVSRVANLKRLIVFLVDEDVAEIRAACQEEGVAASVKVRQIIRQWATARRAHRIPTTGAVPSSHTR